MNRAAFIRQERRRQQQFSRQGYTHPSRIVRAQFTFSCRYECECGFETSSAGKLWDHVAKCKEVSK